MPPRLLTVSASVTAVVLAAFASGAAVSAKKPTPHVSAEARLDAIRRAHVWQATDVKSMDLRAGPKEPGSFAPHETVACKYTDKEMSGHSPKFTCVIPPDDEVKVKFGRENGEVYSEVAATRLFWALGFPVDRMYPVRVVCTGCPGGQETARENGALVFDPASIERKLKGWAIETAPDSGWAWSELDRVDEAAGGAPHAQRDALKLLAVFVQHTDNKPPQQRLICVDEHPGKEHGRCEQPVMMVNDLGQTFGRSNLFNRDQVGSANLEKWSGSHVWADARLCIGDLPPTQTGSLANPHISEEGRKFLSDLLMQLTDAQLRELFDVARFAERKEGHLQAGTVEQWVEAFKKKRGEIAGRICPS